MWRALFYATGAMLIVLGVECIVFGRFAISSDSSLSKVANKVLGRPSSNLVVSDDGNSGYGTQRGSRFGDPFSNASSSNRTGAFNLPNYNGSAVLPNNKPLRIVKTEDWMPWSLIAIGTIITLYTHSLGRNGSGR